MSPSFAVIAVRGSVFNVKKMNGEPLCREKLEGCTPWLPFYHSHLNVGAGQGGSRADKARAYSALWALLPALACTLQLQGWPSSAHRRQVVLLVGWPPARLKSDLCPSSHFV